MQTILIIFTNILVLISCTSCSFIQERFGLKPQPNQHQENEQTEQPKQEPIPVNPQHS